MQIPAQLTLYAVEYESEVSKVEKTQEIPSTTPGALLPSNIPASIMPLSGFPGLLAQVTEEDYVGTAKWYLFDDGTLVVHGGMIQWPERPSPWHSYNNDIKRIIFTDDITSGTLLRGLFADLTEVYSISGLERFNTNNLTGMTSMFSGASCLEYIYGLCGWNTSNVTNMSYLFSGANSLKNLNLSDWDTSSVEQMRDMFLDASSLTGVGDLSGWDVRNVTTMLNMFSRASALSYIGDISGWETDSLTNVASMFNDASSLNNIGNLSGWNTSNITIMASMFNGAISLNNIGDLSTWDTGRVERMDRMFMNANSLENLNLSTWDTSSLENMLEMFRNTTSLKSIGDLSKWDTSNVRNMADVFNGASSLTNLGDLSLWDTGSAEIMTRMFSNAGSLYFIGDLSGWNTEHVTRMDSMFYNASNLTSLDLSSWDTGRVTNMSNMFRSASSLNSVGNLSEWNTSKVTNMASMFNGASSLVSLNLSGWNTQIVTHTGQMFDGASSLQSLNLYGWDTRHSPTRTNMFRGATNLRILTLGEYFLFTNSALPPIQVNNIYTGNWINVGSGTIYIPIGEYELSSAQLMSRYNGSTMADTWVWQRTPFWGISLLGNHTFPDAIEGHSPLTPFNVTVTNVGNQPTGLLTVELSGVDAGSFTLSLNSITNIAVGGNTSFTVVPNMGLAPGIYTARVTVSGENGILEYLYVSFTVNELVVPSPSPTITPSASPEAPPTAPPTAIPTISPAPTASPIPTISPTTIPSSGDVYTQGSERTTTAPRTTVERVRPSRPEPLPIPLPPSNEQGRWIHRWYIRGYPEGDVRPDGFMTRAEMAAMFFNLSESPDKRTAFYNAGYYDVNPEDWHFRAINYMTVRHNALSGFPDGTFRPNQHITNAEFAAFATEFFNLRQLAPRTNFADQFDHWASDFIAYSFDSLWFDYFGHNYVFLPDAPIPRAIAVTLLNHYMGRVPNPDSIQSILQGRLIFSDITPQNHWGFYEIMEAAVGHDFSLDDNGLEIWTNIFFPNGG